MAERDHILADFQACTGIENIEECIAILEQYDWKLTEAVQSAMAGLESPSLIENPLVQSPPEVHTIPDEPIVQPIPVRQTERMDFISVDEPGSSSSASAFQVSASAGGSAATSRGTRMLHFNVEYQDKNISLVLADNEVVCRLKELLESEVGIPVSKQHLGGWVNKNDRRISDEDVLRDLKLPKENTLFLLAPSAVQGTSSSSCENSKMLERLSQTFTLNIHYRDQDKAYKLNFPGSKTVQEVKGDVFSLLDLPVRHQVWVGWPEGAKDETMTLAGSGISYPCHSLELSRASNQENNQPRQHNTADDPLEISDDEFDEAPETFSIEDDMFASEESSHRRPNPLMPENVQDQEEALEHFSMEFGNRYGECHPVFYIGSLENAIKDALQVKAKDRKLLAIYLHHDNSILSNVFCSQILCSETIVSYLSTNFLIWAWDLTTEANRARLLTMCTNHFGSVAAQTVRNFRPDQLPLLLIISRSRSMNEVSNVIHANITLDELMSQLIQAVDVFNEQQQTEIVEEEERESRERVKTEQDLAYEESLALDRAKKEARQAQIEIENQKRLEDEMKAFEDERQRKEEEMEKEAIRQSLAEQLPEEPPSDCSEPVSIIRFRAPGGEIITRRFLAQNPLNILLNFVASKGYHIEDYKVLTTFPRRDLTSLDGSKTLQELKLFPQETLMLEEKGGHGDEG